MNAVQADRAQLQQVLLNLLANAVKFSPEKSSVEAGSAPDAGGVRFWVKDNGPGISPEIQRNLFQPFFQASHAGWHITEFVTEESMFSLLPACSDA